MLDHYIPISLFSRDQPVVIEDAATDERLMPTTRRMLADQGTHSLILFPLVASDTWFGMLNLHFPSRWDPSEATLLYLRGLVGQVAVALHNMLLLKAEAKARHEAEQANAVKMQFLATISHELRTPLTSIKGFATTLLADDVTWDPESQRSFVETISEEADKLTELIDQLLNVSRIELGRLPMVPQVVTLDDVIGAARVDLETLSARHRLEIDISPGLPPIYADSRRIAQVVINLVNNAAKYAPPATPIRIAARREQDAVRVDVSDEGPGIPPEDRERVFEAFQRGQNTRSEHVNGVGLGLAICQGIVKAHGGQMWIVDSDVPGTTVAFTIPLASPSPDSSEPPPET